MHTIVLGLCYRQSDTKTNVLKYSKKNQSCSLPAYNTIMLYYITFYYTFSVIVIVGDLKVPSLHILCTEHYRVSLCRSETISFLVITFPALENKRLLATDVAGTASSRLATAATDGYFWRFVAHQDSGFWLCESVGSAR